VSSCRQHGDHAETIRKAEYAQAVPAAEQRDHRRAVPPRTHSATACCISRGR
jgi:hypothetical protein